MNSNVHSKLRISKADHLDWMMRFWWRLVKNENLNNRKRESKIILSVLVRMLSTRIFFWLVFSHDGNMVQKLISSISCFYKQKDTAFEDFFSQLTWPGEFFQPAKSRSMWKFKIYVKLEKRNEIFTAWSWEKALHLFNFVAFLSAIVWNPWPEC